MINIVDRRAEYRDDGIADIFIDEAAVFLNDVGHRRQIFVHEFNQIGRRERLGNGGKSGVTSNMPPILKIIITTALLQALILILFLNSGELNP